MDIFINQLKIKLSEKTPDNELIERIMPNAETDWKYQPKVTDEGEQIIEFTYLEEIVHYLCYRNIDMVRKIAGAHDVSNKDLIRIAEITFDFLIWKNVPESAFFIVDYFLLDGKRTTYGVLFYVRKLINEGNYQKASEIIQSYKGKIITEQMTQWGTRLYKQMMTFDKSETERDYTKAFKLQAIFSLKPSITEPFALIQYDYNMSRENYQTAAEIAKVFQLGKTRMKRAAIEAFKLEFQKFTEKADSGEYCGKMKLLPDDPYVNAVNILTEYAIMEERHSTDAFSQSYYKEASDAAFFFLKKIISLPESEKISSFTKSFLTANLIADYNLNDVINIERATASDQIIGGIVRKLDHIITNLNQAELHYTPILKLFNVFSSHKFNLIRLAYRLFEIFIKNDKIELSYKTFIDFKLEKREILKTLMDRCLIFLKLNNIKEFVRVIEIFSIVSDLKNVNEFMEQVYQNYDKHIFNKSYDTANTISSIFKFPKKRIVYSTVCFCRELLLKEDDNEVIKIMYKFDLSNKHLRNVFNEIYNIRIISSWKKGYDFRMKFSISIMGVGFFKWLIGEILRFERITSLYYGEDIITKRKKSD